MEYHMDVFSPEQGNAVWLVWLDLNNIVGILRMMLEVVNPLIDRIISTKLIGEQEVKVAMVMIYELITPAFIAKEPVPRSCLAPAYCNLV